MQLPQYIWAAPAVKARIFIQRTSDGALKSAPGVQVIEQIALVRLVPTDAIGGNRAQVQASDVRRGEQPRDQLAILRDRGYYQAWAKRPRDLILAHGNHTG